jgi:tetraacyldisaccharide 4'-kinase
MTPPPILGRLPAAIARARRRYVTGRPDLRRRLARPVVSVGNLSVGGRGKTPLVHALAGWLRDEGWRPSILSRGYGRSDRADGVVIVSDGSRMLADLARAGDEPLMLARSLPGVAVLVCPDRHLAGRLAERHLGCDIHLLDDGFQHLALERTVDLVLVDSEDLAAAAVLPFGRLREPIDALRDADAVMWTGDGSAEALAAWLGVADVFRVERRSGPIHAGVHGDVAPAAGTRVVALAGIARPGPFVEGLRADGYEVSATVLFADHHRYGEADLARVRTAVRESGAAGVVTTEKDWMRLLPLRPLGFAAAWRGVTVTVEPFDAFARWLRARVGSPVGPETVA